MDRGIWQTTVHGVTKNQTLSVHAWVCMRTHTHTHRHTQPLATSVIVSLGLIFSSKVKIIKQNTF